MDNPRAAPSGEYRVWVDYAEAEEDWHHGDFPTEADAARAASLAAPSSDAFVATVYDDQGEALFSLPPE